MRNIQFYFLILTFCGCMPSKNVKANISLHEIGIPSVIEVGSKSYSKSDYGIIRGQFFNRIDSLPIAKALVKLTEFITIADENGKFSIDLPPYSNPYNIEFSCFGFNSISKSINLENKEIVDLKIYLGVTDSCYDFTTEKSRKLKKKL